MRFGALALTSGVVAALAPATLSAQKAFEGIITLGSSVAGRAGQTTMQIKGPRVRIEGEDATRGPFSYIKDENGQITMIIPSRRQYVVLPNVQGVGVGHKYVATGRNDTIAGYPCQYYQILDANGQNPTEQEACVTTALGFVAAGPFSGPLPETEMRNVRQQFRDGFMILKASRKGKGSVQVSTVERTAVNDAVFALPSGYTEIRMPTGVAARP